MSNDASLPLRSLIRDNISVVLSYAYSREPLERLLSEGFVGEWENLSETVLVTSRHRAERSLLELALLLRHLDDRESVGKYVADRTNFSFGTLSYRDGTAGELALRDVANKVIHASKFEWEHLTNSHPSVVCHSGAAEKWVQARVDLVCLAAVCGNFAR